jgi:hypothetical protein
MIDSTAQPRSLLGDASFPHKHELQAAIRSGATMRREERTIVAESHFGTFRIRLNIARDPQITKGQETIAASAALDMEFFLRCLEKDLTAVTRAWHVRGANGERFTLIENEATGEPLGCLYSLVQSEEQTR